MKLDKTGTTLQGGQNFVVDFLHTCVFPFSRRCRRSPALVLQVGVLLVDVTLLVGGPVLLFFHGPFRIYGCICSPGWRSRPTTMSLFLFLTPYCAAFWAAHGLKGSSHHPPVPVYVLHVYSRIGFSAPLPQQPANFHRSLACSRSRTCRDERRWQ